MKTPLRPPTIWLVGVAMLMAPLLASNLLVSHRFHHDEALYGTWAMQIASGQDPWLHATPIDKPPLPLYLIAAAMWLVGPTETAARLPAMLATASIIGLTFALAHTLYDTPTALVAAWAVSLSPFTLTFAPTAFTDPLLVAFMLTSCLLAAHRRPLASGLFSGLAFATKQQALIFLPLPLILLLIKPTSRHAVARFMLSFLLTSSLPFLWDANRPQMPSFLLHSARNYGGLTLDWGGFSERFVGFSELLWYSSGSSMLNTIFLIGLPWLLLRHRHHHDWLFASFVLLFLLIHSLLTFQLWDRYLLGLIPLLALLLSRLLCTLSRRPLIHVLALLLLLMLMLPPATDAVMGRYPLGSNSAALHGIEQLVAYLQGHVGAESTLYHQWLGPHWRFYLWGYPYDLQFWDDPTTLAAHAELGHYIAFPTWHSETPARLALRAHGLHLKELTRAHALDGHPTIILYRIVPANP